MTRIIDESKTYKPAAVKALFKLKKTRIMLDSADDNERFEALKTLIEDLAEVYELPKPKVIRVRPLTGPSVGSFYNPTSMTIGLTGKLSIITALHEFAHHRFGSGQFKTQKWALNLFKKVYPIAFENLQLIDGGAFAVKPGDYPELEERMN